MRNIFTQATKKTDGSIRPGENNLPYGNLSVAHHNKEIAATGRTTTTYIITNDNNDSAVAGSFFLLPDPYAEIPKRNPIPIAIGTTGSGYQPEYDFEEEEIYDQPFLHTINYPIAIGTNFHL